MQHEAIPSFKEEEFGLACFGQSIHHHISAYLQVLRGRNILSTAKWKIGLKKHHTQNITQTKALSKRCSQVTPGKSVYEGEDISV